MFENNQYQTPFQNEAQDEAQDVCSFNENPIESPQDVEKPRPEDLEDHHDNQDKEEDSTVENTNDSIEPDPNLSKEEPLVPSSTQNQVDPIFNFLYSLQPLPKIVQEMQEEIIQLKAQIEGTTALQSKLDNLQNQFLDVQKEFKNKQEELETPPENFGEALGLNTKAEFIHYLKSINNQYTSIFTDIKKICEDTVDPYQKIKDLLVIADKQLEIIQDTKRAILAKKEEGEN